MQRTSCGFTLVELLVVVVIIVVLVALMVPAMDKAMYRAQLALCGANQSTVATYTTLYAQENKRSYPHRPGASDGAANWQRESLYMPPLGTSTRAHDDRPLLRSYLPINKVLNDPLAPGAVDLEADDPRTHTFTYVSLWFGFRYIGHGSGMRRFGDRLQYTQQTATGAIAREFNILVSDYDYVSPDLNWAHSSHPDGEDRLMARRVENGPHPFLGGNAQTLGAAIQYTGSSWLGGILGQGSGRRGPVDVNYTFQDGAVVLYNGVLRQGDERMVDLPAYNNGAAFNFHAPN
jgi:prepilin-type N-terminal cleavage/methylation domain-containing protein